MTAGLYNARGETAVTPERWEQVERLYHAARERTPAERALLLDEACRGDSDLRVEVDSLLAAQDAGAGFLEAPALEVAAHALNETASFLAPGRRLGAYKVTTAIGAGGMGEVWRARDTALGRDVAIKVLPAVYSRDVDRLRRFEHEAYAAGQLNHPNILTIYAVGTESGAPYLVTELLEGETLQERLRDGALPSRKAIDYAVQIAQGLAAAHDKGIVHRDLKPANLFITRDGRVKILDFGLAKLTSTIDELAGPAPSASGMILGTVGYMSPEQARGQAADHRADLFSFGTILYEMLGGQRAFPGESPVEAMNAILKADPPPLPGVSPAIERIIRHCLEKNPSERFQSARDLAFHLDAGREPSGVTGSVSVPSRTSRKLVLASASLSILAVAAAALTVAYIRRAPAVTAPLTLSADIGANASLTTSLGAAAVLSPDGKLLAFVAQTDGSSSSALYVRRLDQLTASRYDGTDGAESPFFSPDGQWIAFFAGGKLKKIGAQGGATFTLSDATAGRGGDWAGDDSIIFTPSTWSNLLRVPAAGGGAEPVGPDVRDGEATRRWPQVLPGGKAVIYTSHSAVLGFDDATIAAQPLPAGERKVLVRGGYYGRYLPSGHLIYMARNALVAVPFDPARLEMTGPAVTVLEGVTSNAERTGGAQFAASANGTLVYLPGASLSNDVPIGWIDQRGMTTDVVTPRGIWSNLRLAPDGRQIAIDILEGAQSHVWVYDAARDGLSRVTSSWGGAPAWTPDGRRIAFATLRGADRPAPSGTFSTRGDDRPRLLGGAVGGLNLNLAWQRADGSGDAQRLTDSPHLQAPGSWHPNGRLLAFQEETSPNKFDLMMLPIEGSEASGWKAGKPTVFLSGPGNTTDPQFSPDGRWIAYVSTETGRREVYVSPASGTGAKWKISTAGGLSPAWSRTTRDLFYATDGDQIMIARYSDPGGIFQPERPRLWSDAHVGSGIGYLLPRRFDVQAGGERIVAALVPHQRTAPGGNSVVFVFNFFDELRRVAPIKK